MGPAGPFESRKRRFPEIAFRGDGRRRRAWVLGTGLDVWEIVALLRDYGTEAELAREYGLTPEQIGTALAYRDAFRDEIDPALELGTRSERELAARYAFIQTYDSAAPTSPERGRSPLPESG